MALARFLHIAWLLLTLLAWWALARLGLLRNPDAPAQRFCRALTRLGGSFVKLGQMLGIRRDLLPDAYAVALQSLQDRVPPFPTAQARREVARALANPIAEQFSWFDEEPLAAASIAQVHRARLSDGRDVVVKVQRPGVRASVGRDLRLLYLGVRLIVLLLPRLQRYRPQELLRELEYNLERELDFRIEAHNIRRIGEGLKHMDIVYVPEVVDDLYSETVLVTELSGGCRIDDPQVTEGARLAEDFVEAYLHQFFVLGFFHGDPHPGNLFIRPDGRICFHDFGLAGFLDRSAQRNLAAFVQAMVNNDSDWLVDAYLDLGIVTGGVDRRELRRGLQELLTEYSALPLSEWSLAEAFLDVVRIGRVQNIRLPHDLLVFMRTAFLIENVVRTLDPHYNLVGSLADKTDEILQAIGTRDEGGAATARLRFELGALLQDAPGRLAQMARSVREEGVEIPIRVKDLDGFGRRLEHSVNRLVIALLAGILFIAASLLMQHSIGPRLWGIPTLSLIGYLWAMWLTVRLLRSVSRAGGP